MSPSLEHVPEVGGDAAEELTGGVHPLIPGAAVLARARQRGGEAERQSVDERCSGRASLLRVRRRIVSQRRSDMHTRTLGQGLEVSASRVGLHGDVAELRAQPRQPRRHDRRAPLGPRPGRDILRHRRGVRALRQRGARRRGARADPRPGARSPPSSGGASRTARASGWTAGRSRSAASPRHP